MWSDLFTKQQSSAREFWEQVLGVACEMTGATNAFLYIRDISGEAPVWRVASIIPTGKKPFLSLGKATSIFESLIENPDGAPLVRAPGDVISIEAHFLGAVCLETLPEEPDCALLIVSPADAKMDPSRWQQDLKWLRPLPKLFHLRSRLTKAEGDVRRVMAALDLTLMLNRETRFIAAAMCLCNELATREGFSRVSLGWLENEEIRLKALNHSEKFEKKMELVRRLEGAMEECLDQDEEIIWPQDRAGQAVTREHAEFAKLGGSAIVVSLPLRVEGKCVGALTLEREDPGQPVNEGTVEQLRIYGDLLSRRLDDLHCRDRWPGGFLWMLMREQLSRFMGPRYVGWKLAGAAMALLLLVLVFGRMTYRVEAPFALKSNQAVYITAPFDGYLYSAQTKVGDAVRKGDVLAQLDDRELRLQETDLRAQSSRYLREAEKARSENDVATMRINRAKVEELKARLGIIVQRLKYAVIVSPLHGMIIEGDLHERVGAPFKRGDVMFRISGLEEVYIEARIDERDIDEIGANVKMEVAFASRPDLVFETTLEQIDPVAVSKQDGNYFLAKSPEVKEFPGWWRPGMSGIAKIEVGSRTFLWILTHRTIDFLHLKLWI